MVLEIGKQKHARGFEVGKRAMQDRQSTRNCMQFSVDCPKTMFFLCLPQALYLEFRIEKAIYSMTFIFYFIENRITINNRSKIQNSFNVKRSLSFIPPLGTNLFSILSVINCNVP